jgi:acetyl-CoA carboxylase biotin carboxyl carrier protein
MKAVRTGKKAVEPSAAKRPASSFAQEVAALAEVMRAHDLGEVEVEKAGIRIRIRRGAEGMAAAPLGAPPVTLPSPAALPAPMPLPVAPIEAPAKAEISDGNISYITSPFVGTFYRSPGPDSAPFVDAGTHVKKGQVICIVEAMKLMNEIESEIDGTIVACLVENGQPVEYGEPLFKIRQG